MKKLLLLVIFPMMYGCQKKKVVDTSDKIPFYAVAIQETAGYDLLKSDTLYKTGMISMNYGENYDVILKHDDYDSIYFRRTSSSPRLHHSLNAFDAIRAKDDRGYNYIISWKDSSISITQSLRNKTNEYLIDFKKLKKK